MMEVDLEELNCIKRGPQDVVTAEEVEGPRDEGAVEVVGPRDVVTPEVIKEEEVDMWGFSDALVVEATIKEEELDKWGVSDAAIVKMKSEKEDLDAPQQKGEPTHKVTIKKEKP